MNIPTLEGEIWKEVPGLNGYYFASNFGRIYSVPRTYKLPMPNSPAIKQKSPGRILNQFTEKGGYKRVQISIEGAKRKEKVHRLVCMAFHGLAEGKIVNHKNSIVDDNRPENLEWVTHRENALHAQKNRNKTGVVGLYFSEKRQRYQGSILVGDKRHGIGDHKTIESAIEAYRRKAELLGVSESRYLLSLSRFC